jgi:hypothetical protein
MGRQGDDEITAHDVAALGNTVSYDVLTRWGLRLRRQGVDGEARLTPKLATAARRS